MTDVRGDVHAAITRIETALGLLRNPVASPMAAHFTVVLLLERAIHDLDPQVRPAFFATAMSDLALLQKMPLASAIIRLSTRRPSGTIITTAEHVERIPDLSVIWTPQEEAGAAAMAMKLLRAVERCSQADVIDGLLRPEPPDARP